MPRANDIRAKKKMKYCDNERSDPSRSHKHLFTTIVWLVGDEPDSLNIYIIRSFSAVVSLLFLRYVSTGATKLFLFSWLKNQHE